MKRSILIVCFVCMALVSLLFCGGAQASELGSCGWQDLPIRLEELKGTSDFFSATLSGVYHWNKYMYLMSTYPTDGTWGKNLESEFGGFPSDATLDDAWGVTWGSTLGKTLYFYNPLVDCGEIYESDVVFNPSVKWTRHARNAEGNPDLVYFPSVLMHELGHVWGMQALDKVEDYHYTQPSVMHAYYHDIVQDKWTIHQPEAWCIRRAYDNQVSVNPLNNMVVLSKYANPQGQWENARTDRKSYASGETLTISNMTIENTGTTTPKVVHIVFYLQTDRFDSGSIFLNEFEWKNFPSETYQVLNFDMTIPPNVPSGSYFIWAQLIVDGEPGDDAPLDNDTQLYDKIEVTRKTITVTYPKGGEEWVTGSTKDIRWKAPNLDGTVRIEIIREGVATLIEDNVPNTGSYNWKVVGPPSLRCLIQVTSNSYAWVSATSDKPFTIGDPYIKVLSPKNGEICYLGYVEPIKWESYALNSDVKIEISRDGGFSWTFLTNAANMGSFDWMVQGTPAKCCRFRISSLKDPSIKDRTDGCFQIAKGSYTLVKPNGGENWRIGNKVNILWNREHEDSLYVKVELSRNGGSTWETLSAGALNGRAFEWTVTKPESEHCRIRVTSGKVPLIQDMSDGDFTISPKRGISVTSPNGGETWIVGTQETITWTSRNAGGKVKIEVLRDRQPPQTIAEAAPNTGTFLWPVSGVESSACRIRITSVQYPGTRDTSDADFTIGVQRDIAVTAPNGGEIWIIGIQEAITWTSRNAGEIVKIEVLRDRQPPQTIADAAPNTGTFLWPVSGVESSACRIRITSVQYPGTQDTSDADFKIGVQRDITVTAPNGGEIWIIGARKTIAWTSRNAGETVKIEVLRDRQPPQIIVDAAANTGTYPWTVSGEASSACRVRITSVQYPGTQDTSDADFTVKTGIASTGSGTE